MQIDVAKQLGAVTRSVRSTEVEGKQAAVVVATQTYPTSADDLWNAITSAERLPRWFAPVTGDLRLGGRYQVQGNAGGTILECAPPTHFKLTWEFGGDTSWVEVTIESLGKESARLTLEHTAHVSDHWKKFGPGATGVGWDLAFAGLGRHLATGATHSPEEGMQWMMSEAGKSFARGSSHAWRLAHIASGADPDAAKTAAEQTAKAYTGEA